MTSEISNPHAKFAKRGSHAFAHRSAHASVTRLLTLFFTLFFTLLFTLLFTHDAIRMTAHA
jgi:hypothetical protein